MFICSSDSFFLRFCVCQHSVFSFIFTIYLYIFLYIELIIIPFTLFFFLWKCRWSHHPYLRKLHVLTLVNLTILLKPFGIPWSNILLKNDNNGSFIWRISVWTFTHGFLQIMTSTGTTNIIGFFFFSFFYPLLDSDITVH